MNHIEAARRRRSIIAAADMMTAQEIARVYNVSVGYVRNILHRAGKRAKHPSADWHAAVLANYATSSFADLERLTGIKSNTIGRFLYYRGLRIGMRRNVRSHTSRPHRQIEILAFIKQNPQMSYSEIGFKFACTRELVSQIACDGRRLGLIPPVIAQSEGAA